MNDRFDMTQPEAEARRVSSEVRQTGMTWADAKHEADECEADAEFREAAASKAARCGKIEIGETPTVQAVKDWVATDPSVERARMAHREAKWAAHKAELAFKAAEGDREMFKGLLYAKSRSET